MRLARASRRPRCRSWRSASRRKLRERRLAASRWISATVRSAPRRFPIEVPPPRLPRRVPAPGRSSGRFARGAGDDRRAAADTFAIVVGDVRSHSRSLCPRPWGFQTACDSARSVVGEPRAVWGVDAAQPVVLVSDQRCRSIFRGASTRANPFAWWMGSRWCAARWQKQSAALRVVAEHAGVGRARGPGARPPAACWTPPLPGSCGGARARVDRARCTSSTSRATDALARLLRVSRGSRAPSRRSRKPWRTSSVTPRERGVTEVAIRAVRRRARRRRAARARARGSQSRWPAGGALDRGGGRSRSIRGRDGPPASKRPRRRSVATPRRSGGRARPTLGEPARRALQPGGRGT